MRNPEHSPGFGRFGPHGGGGRRRKLFDSEELQLICLSFLRDQPQHGYHLIQTIQKASGGIYTPSPGVIYPLLSMLLERGFINELATDAAKKVYEISEDGSAYLDGDRQTFESARHLRQKLVQLASSAARVDPSPVRRAMHNLRAVLEERLRRDDATPETAFAAAALIDGAAQSIERL